MRNYRWFVTGLTSKRFFKRIAAVDPGGRVKIGASGRALRKRIKWADRLGLVVVNRGQEGR